MLWIEQKINHDSSTSLMAAIKSSNSLLHNLTMYLNFLLPQDKIKNIIYIRLDILKTIDLTEKYQSPITKKQYATL